MSSDGLARARQDLDLPATARDGDVPVAAFVAARFGHEVVDRLVDPLLAGVYAGRSEELSFEATLPAIAGRVTQARLPGRRRPARAAAGSRRRPGSPGPVPVFTTLAGGLGTLPAAVAAASGATVRTCAMVRGLARTATGWRLTVGSATRRGVPDGRRGHPGRPGQPRGAAARRRVRGVRRGDGAAGRSVTPAWRSSPWPTRPRRFPVRWRAAAISCPPRTAARSRR